jgi:hypothetical protein
MLALGRPRDPFALLAFLFFRDLLRGSSVPLQSCRPLFRSSLYAPFANKVRRDSALGYFHLGQAVDTETEEREQLGPRVAERERERGGRQQRPAAVAISPPSLSGPDSSLVFIFRMSGSDLSG